MTSSIPIRKVKRHEIYHLSSIYTSICLVSEAANYLCDWKKQLLAENLFDLEDPNCEFGKGSSIRLRRL